MTELEFQIERGGIFSTAIGLARLALKNQEIEKAQEYLDKACDDVERLWYDHLIAIGYEEKLVRQFLGMKEV